MIELDFDESEALFSPSFLPSLTTLQRLTQAPPPRTPPQALQEGEEVHVYCLSEESQCVCNNKPRPLAITPQTEGEKGRGQGWCLKARHAVGLCCIVDN